MTPYALAIAQRNSRLFQNTSDEAREKFVEFTTSFLAKKTYAHAASGTRPCEESISYLRQAVRDAGFRLGGSLGDFEDFLLICGFEIRDSGTRRYVGLHRLHKEG